MILQKKSEKNYSSKLKEKEKYNTDRTGRQKW